MLPAASSRPGAALPSAAQRRRRPRPPCATPTPPPDPQSSSSRDFDTAGGASTPWALLEGPWPGLPNLLSNLRSASVRSSATPLAPLDAALLAELGGRRRALEALIGTLESEILAELSSFPAEKLPSKRVASQAMFLRCPALTPGPLPSPPELRPPPFLAPGLRAPSWGGWSAPAVLLALRSALMTASALAAATNLGRVARPRRGGLLVLLPDIMEGENEGNFCAPALAEALWRDPPFAVGGLDDIITISRNNNIPGNEAAVLSGDPPVAPGAVLLVSLCAPGGCSQTDPEKVLESVQILRDGGIPFVLCSIRLEGVGETNGRANAEASMRRLLSRLKNTDSLGDRTRSIPLPDRIAQLCGAASGDLDTVLLQMLLAEAVALPSPDESNTLAVAQARARLAAAQLESKLRLALSGEISAENALPRLRSVLSECADFNAAMPPLPQTASAALTALMSRAAGRAEALEQVAAARRALVGALSAHTEGLDVSPAAVGAKEADALQLALQQAAEVAWPWQLAAEVAAGQRVAVRWATLRALTAAAESAEQARGTDAAPAAATLQQSLQAVSASHPDVDVSSELSVLERTQARAALAAGDTRLSAYDDAQRSVASQGNAEVAEGGRLLLLGLRKSLRISDAEMEALWPPSEPPASPVPAEADADTAAAAAGAEGAGGGGEVSGDGDSWRYVADGALCYDEQALLGEGSRGTTVFLGRSRRTSRTSHPAAIKRLVRSPAPASRMQQLKLAEREVELLGALGGGGPGGGRVVQLLGWAQQPDFLFIATELCAEDLGAHLARSPEMGLAARLHLCAEAGECVAWLHAAGVAHNDLKPGNFLVASAESGRRASSSGSNGGVRLKLGDLGLAVRLDSPPQTQKVSAAPAADDFSLSTFLQYGVTLNPRLLRPPEVLQGIRLTAAADIWSLGIVFWHILTGGGGTGGGCGGPFDGIGGRLELSALMHCVKGAPRAALEARHLLACMLAVEPSVRPSSAAVLRHPLFWSAPTALRAAKELHDSGCDADSKLMDAAFGNNGGGGDGAAVERSALLAAAACDLQGWQARVSGPLFERLQAYVRVGEGYSDSFSGLLRFARNAYEHPPNGAEATQLALAMAEARGGSAVEDFTISGAPKRQMGSAAERRAVLGEYLLTLFPTLALACFECGAAAAEGEAAGAGAAPRRRRRKAAAPAEQP